MFGKLEAFLIFMWQHTLLKWRKKMGIKKIIKIAHLHVVAKVINENTT